MIKKLIAKLLGFELRRTNARIQAEKAKRTLNAELIQKLKEDTRESLLDEAELELEKSKLVNAATAVTTL
ncbi:hypothetical protein [Vibrio phage vB_VpaP_G1]|uniref:Uncharacterized protein n=1 Tax=Vibrio phage vB_VpaP_G1 TaxID=2862773 RepID=A0AAE7WU99_9CAUD|nr:hypothetical protein PP280_gp05 [Vibrio phage vB_VpaP_G1]YP_010648437.1 hypothetical protein PP280_gp49 [Vibrio phage vB_VpaP_G1]QYW05805.1 hypothetical protein [Vibrio phage vB_VpaP_G1]QYW05849.1 hypothetical protein [Vibrio phage vB_VpaP_G1]